MLRLRKLKTWSVPVALALMLAACGQPARSRNAASLDAKSKSVVTSNVLRGDYAGSAACSACHEGIYSRWMQAPMHRMTRDIHNAHVVAPFKGERFSFKADTATMFSSETERFLQVRSISVGDRLFRLTKVLGGRVREDFVGVPVAAATSDARALGEEQVLPVSYLIFNAEWRYKGYSVMVKERPALAEGLVWKKTCIFCHNTAPHLSTILDELYGERAPAFQGSASVELPETRRFRYDVHDPDALRRALILEQKFLGSSVNAHDTDHELLSSTINLTSEAFGEAELIEVGIGCEACHNGAREHAKNPARLPTFALQNAAFDVKTAKLEVPTHAQDINRTCTKCHTVLFSRYPHTWEGGSRSSNPGGSNINSGEGRDFLLGGCASEQSCASCHDPHAEDGRAQLAKFETSAGNAVCTHCHAQYVDDKLSAHTHHSAASAGSVCVNCHMPKKNMGLSYQLTRYHRIGSPTDAVRVEHDRPLECALCHADKSVDQLLTTMERFWGKHYDRKALRALYGNDLRVNIVTATLLTGKPHEKAVAATLAGETRFERSLPLLISELDNAYPLVRFYMKNAVEHIVGEKLPLDMHASGEDLVVAADRWFKARNAANPAANSAP